jgi:K+-transporting ATPase ATPase C chain
MPSLRRSAVMLIVFTVLCGGVYPALVTGLAKALFPKQAEGSLLYDVDGKAVGSALIGQQFDSPKYFAGRPSATPSVPYNAAFSGGSNLSNFHPALLESVKARVAALKAADPGNDRLVPVDLVTASAGGLDPHISQAAAEYQIRRVARTRGLPEERVRKLVAEHTQGQLFGFLGESVVHVLKLNLALDGRDLR